MDYDKQLINAVLTDLAKNIAISEISTKYGISIPIINTWQELYHNEIFYIRLSLKMKTFSKIGGWDETLAFLDSEEFKNEYSICSQKINILRKQNRLKEALSLASEDRFKNDLAIQSQRIGILIKMNKLEEALELASEDRFKDYFPIQSQIIGILIKTKNLKKALNLANEDRFNNYYFIQSQKITILIRMNKLTEALNLASEDRFKDYFTIQSQKITILVRMNKLEEALNLASEERFKGFRNIEYQREQILKRIANSKKVKSNYPKVTSKDIAKEILNSLTNTDVSENTILESNIFEWQKVILIIALYEKNNYPTDMAIRFLKRQKTIYQNNPYVLNIINALLARIKIKRKLFSMEFYAKLLNTPVTFPTNEKEYLQDLSEANHTKPLERSLKI